jgi:hypothetical protein
MAELLEVDRSTVTRQMRKHGTLTSVNRGGAFCILPEMCRFDDLGFCTRGGTVFFRDGCQLDAIVRLVTESARGMELREISEAVGSRTAMQVLKLVREGRLGRAGRPRAYVYSSADEQVAARQLERRRDVLQDAEKDKASQTLAEQLAGESREELQLLVEVLMTCLRHPQFSAKSVALWLLRRGCRTCTEQVGELFKRFDLEGKKGS